MEKSYYNKPYVNHCWNCKSKIDSDNNEKCSNCGLFICSSCGSCFCDMPKNDENDDEDESTDYRSNYKKRW